MVNIINETHLCKLYCLVKIIIILPQSTDLNQWFNINRNELIENIEAVFGLAELWVDLLDVSLIVAQEWKQEAYNNST